MDKTLIKFGFVEDNRNLQLREIFRNNIKLKEVHMDIYPDNPLKAPVPFVLLLRAIERNVSVLNDNNRLILKKNDRFGTYIVNVSLSDVSESHYKMTDTYCEFIVKIQNIYYRIIIIN